MHRFLWSTCIVTSLWLAPAAARADCPIVDRDLAAAKASLRGAQPARDASQADVDRRLSLVADAFTKADAAETVRSTTPGGCGNLQQVYDQLLTVSWAEVMFAYLKPSLDFHVTDPACKAISKLQTTSMIMEADEAMRRSLISWNPFDDGVIADRAHVTRLVDEAASYLGIALPPDTQAEDYARQDAYVLAAAKTKNTVDCLAAVDDPHVPPALLHRVFDP